MPPTRAPLRFAAAAAGAFVVLLAGPTAGAGASSATHGRATFGVQPVTAGAPDGRPSLTYAVTPGAQLDDRVALVNYGRRPLGLKVYAADAVNDPSGRLTVPAAGTPASGAGAWLAVASDRPGGTTVRVPARSHRILPMHLQVPADATPGDHVAGIIASLTAIGRGGDVNVALDQRVGIRVFIRVAGELDPALNVDALHTDFHPSLNPVGPGSATVRYRVRNTGNVALGVRQEVSVGAWIGGRRVARPTDVPLLLPGSSVDVVVEIRDVWPAFRDQTTVTLTPVDLQGNSGPSLGERSVQAGFWAIPWASMVAVAALVTAAAWWRHRRRNRVPVGRHRARVARPATTIQEAS